jgi:hypothetical protein
MFKFKISDKVKMVNCMEASFHEEKGKENLYEVISEEWELCGTKVVNLKNFSGGFDVDCLEKIN